MPARKGKHLQRRPVGNPAAACVDPITVAEKAAIATIVTAIRRGIARDFNKFLS
jgi:hypothetical protein